MKRMSFVAAMLDYFGKNGKSNMDFMQEIKKLTDEDKVWFRKELPSVGYEILDTVQS
jgi:hypothetical protein